MNYIQSYANGKTRRKHQIIMEQHLGRPLRKDEVVHHIDGNKRNNDISNLIVVTRAEHARIHSKDICRNKSVDQFSKDGKFIRTWDSMKQAADVLGMDNSSICMCCKGKLKTSGGFIWSYSDRQ